MTDLAAEVFRHFGRRRLPLELDVQVFQLAAAPGLVLDLPGGKGGERQQRDETNMWEALQHRPQVDVPKITRRIILSLQTSLTSGSMHSLVQRASRQAGSEPRRCRLRSGGGPAEARPPTHRHILLRQQHALEALLLGLPEQRGGLAEGSQPAHHFFDRQVLWRRHGDAGARVGPDWLPHAAGRAGAIGLADSLPALGLLAQVQGEGGGRG